VADTMMPLRNATGVEITIISGGQNLDIIKSRT
jgi:hypothetical protein